MVIILNSSEEEVGEEKTAVETCKSEQESQEEGGGEPSSCDRLEINHERIDADLSDDDGHITEMTEEVKEVWEEVRH